MAELNPEVKGIGNAPNFLGRSQGWDPAPPTKSGALETAANNDLFKMGAELIDGLEKGVRNLITEDIKNEVLDANDRDLAFHGINDVESLFGEGNRTPSEIASAEQNIARLNKAAKAGVISEQAMAARLHTTSQSLRAKYPTFRGEIDAMFSKYTGMVPANEIRAGLIRNAEKASTAGDKAAKDRLEYVERLSLNGSLPANWKNMSHEELIDYAAPIATDKERMDYLDKQAKLNKDNKELAKDYEIRSATTKRRQTMSVFMGEANIKRQELGGKSMMDLFDEFSKSGTKASPEQAAQLSTLINAQRAQHVGTLQAYYVGETNLTKDEINQQVEAVNQWYDTMNDAINDNNFGYFKLLNNQYEAVKSKEEEDYVKDVVGARTLRAANRSMGQRGTDFVLNYMDTKMKDDVQKSLFNKLTKDIITNGGPITFKTHIENINRQTGERGAPLVARGLIDTAKEWANDKEMPKEARIKSLNYLFAGGNTGVMDKWTAENRTKYMLDVASLYPAVKEINDPEVSANYDTWMKENFLSSTMISSRTLQGTAVNSNQVNITYNPKTFQFEVKANPDANLNLDVVPGPGLGKVIAGVRNVYDDVVVTKPGIAAVENINANIRAILPILKEQGKDPNKYIQSAFAINGINEGQAKEKWRSNPDLFSGMFTSMADAIVSTANPKLGENIRDVREGVDDIRQPPMRAGVLSKADLEVDVSKASQVLVDPLTADMQEWDEMNTLLKSTRDPELKEMLRKDLRSLLKVIRERQKEMKGDEGPLTQ